MRHTIIALICAGALAACSTHAKSPDVRDSIRKTLDDNGLKDVSVSQDRDKGVVTLTGHVPADTDKAQAESIAKGLAIGEVVADEVIVTPPGIESDAKKIDAALDSGIEDNVKALFLQNGVDKNVKYSAKAGVVTLTGTVDSEVHRNQAAAIAAGAPNVRQVVNEIQVKGQKATSRGGGE